MAAYVPYYALVASSLHALTKKDRAFPTGSKWIPGSDYDLAYHYVKSLILDRPCIYGTRTTKNTFSSKSTVPTTDGGHAHFNTQTRPHQAKTKENITFLARWLPWDGTAYAVPQYRGSTRIVFCAK